MYLIANVTNKIYTIGDLNITLNGGEATDLDARKLSISPDQSKDLKFLVGKGKVKILKRDSGPLPSKSQEKQNGNLKEDIIDGVGKKLKEAFKQIQPNDNSSVLGMLEAIKDMLLDGSTRGTPINVPKEEADLDDKTLKELHQKVVEKSKKGASGTMSFVQTTIEDSDLKEKASKLDDLLENNP